MPIDGVNLRSFLLKLPSLYFGLFLFAAGSVTNLYSGLGMSPWGVFHVGVSGISGLTLGQVSQLVGLAVLLLGWWLGFPPGWGTVSNMIFIGWFTDRIMEWGLVPKPTDIIGQYILLILSVVFVGLGSLFYMRVQLGAGPRDGLMVGLVRKLNKPISLVRGSIEVTVLILGYFLGGPVGIGTVVTALSIGYSVQYAFKYGKFDGKSKQMNLWELYGYLLGERSASAQSNVS
jgi:uncharacterized membrane protein YczE